MVKMYLNPNSPIPLIEFNNFFTPELLALIKERPLLTREDGMYPRGQDVTDANGKIRITQWGYPHWEKPFCDKDPVMKYMSDIFLGEYLPQIEKLLNKTILFEEARGILQMTHPGVVYEPHTDMHQKVGTFLIYIAPKQSDGTIFHKTHDLDPYTREHITTGDWEQPWEVNKGYFFLRDDYSWHSYRNTHGENRYVFMYNLINPVR